jgi:hypothetical protein
MERSIISGVVVVKQRLHEQGSRAIGFWLLV